MRTVCVSSGRWGLRVAVVVLCATAPFACALVAVAYAPPARLEVAGQTVSVKPVLGQDTSRLLDGALVRPEHAHLEVIGKDVGVNVEADWNRLIPSDKRTRSYLAALWEDPTPQIGRLQDAARRHVIVWSAVGFGIGVIAVGGVWLALWYRRRRLATYPPDQAALIRSHNRLLRRTAAAGGLVLLVGADVLAVRVYTHQDQHTVVGSPVFAGTALEGTEVNGLVSDVLPFVSIVRPRSTFYATVADNLEQAITDEPSLLRTGAEVVLVLAEDFEDVNGMARQVGFAADLVDASFIALTGDLTFAGLAVETYIIDTVDYYSADRPVYFAPGLHDTQEVVDAAQARGWFVGDGSTHEVEGLTLLAAADPRISTVGNFGTGNVLRDPDVDADTFLADTVDLTCDTQPDLVLLHDHAFGRRIAEAGCHQIAVLDGRSFHFVGPQVVSTASGLSATEFTSGSAGGHVDTRPDPGPVKNPASFAILTIEPDTKEATYAVVTVNPDTSVTVTPEISLDVEYPDFLSTGTTGIAEGQLRDEPIAVERRNGQD